ncbi:uncharacterized protein PGTG_07051 [Puccinia graminis f. sp. tritici CRL 75-36-700-3]|uniref:Uncharacterized protein n=1 Tax=Puccinia graminis f. sp. tritici (strain CRL 75-36-700-3 / race SCCL) TaxID=418459 RepID=E3KAL8_PUCGT|nr:uncharacterized protein PGTG_07051 [Puccinia graminis f. sp. tritici CRL 75-36-700-3]EFP81430.1 hypothetical protein PGTG_07051 [Puccinia graminis f. sp. tritici CRL 75-36-700-3]
MYVSSDSQALTSTPLQVVVGRMNSKELCTDVPNLYLANISIADLDVGTYTSETLLTWPTRLLKLQAFSFDRSPLHLFNTSLGYLAPTGSHLIHHQASSSNPTVPQARYYKSKIP